MKRNEPLETYAAWRKDEAARLLSSSGGLASVVSEQWIRNGGVVYGAAFLRPFCFKHIRCRNEEELGLLRGSKYVQSSLDGIHQSIKEDLCDGKKVLFIGTPCQVAGISNHFKEYHSQLYTIDIICHGTPTVQILKDSIPKEALEKDFDCVEFRNGGSFQLVFKKGNKSVWDRPLAHDLFLKGFFKGIFYREACYRCKFATTERCGDMTLGDFWGVDVSVLNTEMEKGVSLVFTNTSKGKYLLESVSEHIETVSRPIEEAVAGNHQLRHPTPLTWRHKVFRMLYPKTSFRIATICAIPDVILKNLFK